MLVLEGYGPRKVKLWPRCIVDAQILSWIEQPVLVSGYTWFGTGPDFLQFSKGEK
jgi:hypothetical protein